MVIMKEQYLQFNRAETCGRSARVSWGLVAADIAKLVFRTFEEIGSGDVGGQACEGAEPKDDR